MIDRTHSLPLIRQCQLLNLNRSSVCYQPIGVAEEDLRLMRRIDERHLKRPFYGSRRIRDWLQDEGFMVNRKWVQRLMRQMGIPALYPKANTSRPGKGRHKIRNGPRWSPLHRHLRLVHHKQMRQQLPPSRMVKIHNSSHL